MEKKTKINFQISGGDGEVYGEAYIDCTFKQLVESLEGALGNTSYTTLELHPTNCLNIKRHVNGVIR